jgi:hypothetical protein
MAVMEEHNAKVAFIDSMLNKYDYAVYKQFCIDNGFELMTFIQYASYIEPYVPSDPKAVPVVARRSGCCGGGEAR